MQLEQRHSILRIQCAANHRRIPTSSTTSVWRRSAVLRSMLLWFCFLWVSNFNVSSAFVWTVTTKTTASSSSSPSNKNGVLLWHSLPQPPPQSLDRSVSSKEEPQQQQQLEDLGRQSFQSYFDFALDDWQCHAGGAIVRGCNVIVCAPTGAGKTVIGEMALHHHFMNTTTSTTTQPLQQCIYTSPLKALSNQKFMELQRRFGPNVGLSTGDVSLHADVASIVVMTTEVYRNRVSRSTTTTTKEEDPLSSSSTPSAKVVVLDEFHYMGHPGRGGVWEEAVICSSWTPDEVVGMVDSNHENDQVDTEEIIPESSFSTKSPQLVCLSATLSNADSIRAWMEHVTQRRTVLIETTHRPVPLQYLFATTDGLYPLFRNARAGPGAPLGLLGYRGDGTADRQNNDHDGDESEEGIERNHRGFDRRRSTKTTNDIAQMPKGLHVNPALEAAAQRRSQKVQKVLERRKAAWRVEKNQQQLQLDPGKDDSRGSKKQKKRYSENRSPVLGGRSLSPREERKEKERLLKQEMRKAVPSIHALVQRLQQKQLLPAIFFLFSRNGCDDMVTRLYQYMKGPRDRWLEDDHDVHGDDAPEGSWERERSSSRSRGPKKRRKLRQQQKQQSNPNSLLQDEDGRAFRTNSNYLSESVLASIFDDADNGVDFDESSPLASSNWEFYAASGLLNISQIPRVARSLATFNQENEEIALDDELCEQFLFGVGSHHAGLLPAHKSLVERLFQEQLLPVVIATETLAAGINMPARTTVLLSMAKRTSDSAIELLETSNALQMAGRAGRRGLDEAGTCVLVATPFETHTEAARILTGPIAPIQSQFRPSYPLAIQMIRRGSGKLHVAKQLMERSFALWEKKQVKEDTPLEPVPESDESAVDMIKLSAQEEFMKEIMDTLDDLGSDAESLSALLQDREGLKKTSKSFLGLQQMLVLEETTLGYLQKECDAWAAVQDEPDLEDVKEEDDVLLCGNNEEIIHQMEIQQERIDKVQSELNEHPFQRIADLINKNYLNDSGSSSVRGRILSDALRTADPSAYSSEDVDLKLTPRQLSEFAKSAVVAKKKQRKQMKQQEERKQAEEVEEMPGSLISSSWDDMRAILKTLVAYGCLVEEENSDVDSYEITPGGLNVGLLALENSLWTLVALGGAWDVVDASAKYSEYRQAMLQFDLEDEISPFPKTPNEQRQPEVPEILSSHDEAEELREALLVLQPSELAGYISCLVSDNRDGHRNMIESFRQMTVQQQRVAEKSVVVMERFLQVQKDFGVEVSTRTCSLDLSNCEVVTAWASGCLWQEALQISGQSPGDLARTLSRVLDAVRQVANLPFEAARRKSVPGLHPDLRQACRQAARAMNRYPVKDPLAFVSPESEPEVEMIESLEAEGSDPDLAPPLLPNHTLSS